MYECTWHRRPTGSRSPAGISMTHVLPAWWESIVVLGNVLVDMPLAGNRTASYR